jgi:hypothetical protein
MDIDWLDEGRKVSDEVMFHIRIMAVHAVRVLGLSPELIAKAPRPTILIVRVFTVG